MLDREIDIKYWWMPLAIVITIMTVAYWNTLTSLFHTWMNNDDYSHSLLIPLISIFLIWEKRRLIEQTELSTNWRRLPVLLLPIFLYILGYFAADVNSIRASFFVMIVASVWVLYGGKFLKVIAFPISLLFLMIPFPGFVYSQLTFQLQLWSSKYSVELLQLLGVMVYREGNVIDMGFAQFQVVEACNGLRFILPLLTICILIAFYDKMAWWRRAVIILSSIPIAIIANITRIAGTGILAKKVGVEVAQGFFHSFSGWLVFMLVFIVISLLIYVLKKIPEKNKQAKHKVENVPMEKAKFNLLTIAIVIVLILSTPTLAANLGSIEPKKIQISLKRFPNEIMGWTGKALNIEQDIWAYVGGQDYVLIDYKKPNEAPVNFYAVYYEFQNQGAKFFHSPKLCLPGAGWYIERSNVRQIKLPDRPNLKGDTLKFNEMIITKNNRRQIVYYWYQGRGRNYTNEYASKFLMAWDGLLRGRTDGSLVRLVRVLEENEKIEDVRKILDNFAIYTTQKLDEFIPS